MWNNLNETVCKLRKKLKAVIWVVINFALPTYISTVTMQKLGEI